jgi:hypothetical protein
LAECDHSDCELAGWVEDGCISIATEVGHIAMWATGYANGTSYAEAYSPAEIGAQQSCELGSDSGNCEVLGTICSFD